MLHPQADSTKHEIEIQQNLIWGNDQTYSNPDSANQFYERALTLASEQNDSLNMGEALLGIGKTQYIQADYEQALIAYQQALTVFEKLGDTRGIIHGLNGTGIVLNMLGQSRQAIKNHQQAIILCQQIDLPDQIINNLFNISISYDALIEYDTALVYVDSAMSMALAQKNISFLCRTRNHKAEILLNLGEYAKAKPLYEAVLAEESFDNDWEIQFAIAGLSKVYQHLGDYPKSIEMGLRAYAMAKSMNTLWDLQQVSKTLSRSFELNQDFRSAYTYHQLFKSYSDSLFNEAKEKEINFHLFKEQQYKNENLLLENEEYQKAISRKNTLIIGFSILICLTFLLSVILLRYYRLKVRMNKKLAELNSTKDKLFRIIAHDLKSPIGVMMEFTEVLRENLESYNTETIQRLLAALNKSSREGFQLLENLLSWAQSQTGSIPFHPKKQLLNSAYQESLASINAQAELKEIIIKTEFESDLSVFADDQMLQTILRNLIANAIKFSHNGSEVLISAKQRKTDVLICIQDQGIGISAASQQHLFGLDNSQSQPGTNNEKGTGIGLVLCKEFVDKHHGEIWVESEPGKGSTFCFSLPANSL